MIEKFVTTDDVVNYIIYRLHIFGDNCEISV